jgi:hypothetical protein
MEADSMQNNNPLSGHFRQPSVFLKLPSQGKHWPAGSLVLPANGEVGIMPMTAKDEITLRTPDALMNGQGVVSVIESCVPAVKNAWAMPTVDVDALLIAIRIATYGDEMDMGSNCPECQHENSHGLGLGNVLMRVRAPDYQPEVQIQDLRIKFRPLNYLQANKNDIARFEEQKILQLVNDETISAESRAAQFDVHLNKIVESSMNLLTQSTEYITLSDGNSVSNPEYINEFYNNASNHIIKSVNNHLEKLSETARLPPARVQCEACEKEYDVTVSFDYSNFFEPLS